jgi:hypothetical protein
MALGIKLTWVKRRQLHAIQFMAQNFAGVQAAFLTMVGRWTGTRQARDFGQSLIEPMNRKGSSVVAAIGIAIAGCSPPATVTALREGQRRRPLAMPLIALAGQICRKVDEFLLFMW